MSVDSLGRYQLSDMRDRVRRLLDALQLVVNTGTGAETSSTIQDQSFSNTDIVNQINESLIALWSEMIIGKETLFASTVFLSIKNSNPGPYAFPANMLQLRWMKWKDPNIPFVQSGTNPTRPIDWHPMTQVDDPNDYANQKGVFSVPTWRWESGLFYLNEVPRQDNPNGIMLNMVTMPSELVADTDYITTPQFVRILQQAVIYDAAYTIAFSKKRAVPEELAKKREEWHTRLQVMVENAYNVQSQQMIAPRRMVRGSYTGRFNRAARWWR